MIQRLKSALRRYGWWGMAQNVCGKAWTLLGIHKEYMQLWAHDLYPQVEESGVAYQELTLADFEAHRLDDTAWFTPLKMKKLARYFSVPGNRAFGCVVEGRLVAYGWTSEQYLGVSKRLLEEGDGYLWDDYTHPDFRGQGWHGRLIRLREEVLRNGGKRRTLSIIARHNRASRRGYQRCGYYLLERYSFGCRWGKPFMTLRYGKRKTEN